MRVGKLHPKTEEEVRSVPTMPNLFQLYADVFVQQFHSVAMCEDTKHDERYLYVENICEVCGTPPPQSD